MKTGPMQSHAIFFRMALHLFAVQGFQAFDGSPAIGQMDGSNQKAIYFSGESA
jgi:hypothetical protein